jgi:NAD/NADP transhydrogenase beta subunit
VDRASLFEGHMNVLLARAKVNACDIKGEAKRGHNR